MSLLLSCKCNDGPAYGTPLGAVHAQVSSTRMAPLADNECSKQIAANKAKHTNHKLTQSVHIYRRLYGQELYKKVELWTLCDAVIKWNHLLAQR